MAIQEEEHEKYTGAKRVISTDHGYIHDGKGFTVPGISGSLSAGATLKFAFTTPIETSGIRVHWRPANIFGLATAVTAELFKGSSGISGGTVATPKNRNHNSANKSLIKDFAVGATVGADGTLVQILAGGAGGAGVMNGGGGASAEHEHVLSPDTIYSITVTNRSVSTATLASYEFFWYEESLK